MQREPTSEENLGYLNGISTSIFEKPYSSLSPEERITLEVNLLARFYAEEYNLHEYNSLLKEHKSHNSKNAGLNV